MSDSKANKCSHQPGVCVPPAGEKYCSQFCKAAGSEETEIACDCGLRVLNSHEPGLSWASYNL